MRRRDCVRYAVSTLLFCTAVYAQNTEGPTPAHNLAGFWKDPQKNLTVKIRDTGKTSVEMDLGNGITLTGDVTGQEFKLSYTWTAEAAARHIDPKKSPKDIDPAAI